MIYTVRLLESDISFDSAGRPERRSPTPIAVFKVSGAGIDEAMRKAKAEGSRRCGGRRCSVNASTEMSPGLKTNVLIATVRSVQDARAHARTMVLRR